MSIQKLITLNILFSPGKPNNTFFKLVKVRNIEFTYICPPFEPIFRKFVCLITTLKLNIKSTVCCHMHISRHFVVDYDYKKKMLVNSPWRLLLQVSHYES